MSEIIRAEPPQVAVTSWTPRFEISTEEAVALVKQREEFLTAVLRPGIDYGVIPGTGSKPTLLKPGAERVLASMGLHAEIVDDSEPILDFSGEDSGGEPLIFYQRRCRVWRQIGPATEDRMLVASESGSCSSRESKYRYRNAERKCPECGMETTLRQSKGDDKGNGKGNLYCWAKLGGCGTQFDAAQSAQIKKQPVGKVPNPNIADIANTVLKMASKRALVAAAIMATGYSDYLTQDLEDHDAHEEDGDYGPPAQAAPRTQAAPKAQKAAQKPQEPQGRVIEGQTVEVQQAPPAPAQSAQQPVSPPPPAPAPVPDMPAGINNTYATRIRTLLKEGLARSSITKQDVAKIVSEAKVTEGEVKANPTGWLELLDEERAFNMFSMLQPLVEPEKVAAVSDAEAIDPFAA